MTNPRKPVPDGGGDNLKRNPLKGASKTARIPIKVVPRADRLPKPGWLRVKAPTGAEVLRLKEVLRANRLHNVREEATCPNLTECFSGGTATFMILSALCTRRCPFCDVAHGRPRHIADCITAIRAGSPGTRIEILVSDFRGRLERALAILPQSMPDVLNHNLETVPRRYKAAHPHLPTKSGLMMGLGESNDEIVAVMRDLRAHGCELLTIGQYLQPSGAHLSVERYVHPDEFARIGREPGFRHVASGPLVRSSCHAEHQAHGL